MKDSDLGWVDRLDLIERAAGSEEGRRLLARKIDEGRRQERAGRKKLLKVARAAIVRCSKLRDVLRDLEEKR